MSAGFFVDFRAVRQQFAPAEIRISGGQYRPVRAPEKSCRARQEFRPGKTGLEVKEFLQIYRAGLSREKLEARRKARAHTQQESPQFSATGAVSVPKILTLFIMEVAPFKCATLSDSRPILKTGWLAPRCSDTLRHKEPPPTQNKTGFCLLVCIGTTYAFWSLDLTGTSNAPNCSMVGCSRQPIVFLSFSTTPGQTLPHLSHSKYRL